MNVNGLIKKIGESMGYEVAQDLYHGTSPKNITFTYEDEVPGAFADNAAQTETAYIMVSMNTPERYAYMKDKESLKRALQKSDFNVTSIRSWLEGEQKGIERTRRTVFSVNITQPVQEEK